MTAFNVSATRLFAATVTVALCVQSAVVAAQEPLSLEALPLRLTVGQTLFVQYWSGASGEILGHAVVGSVIGALVGFTSGALVHRFTHEHPSRNKKRVVRLKDHR
jgi:hypothetical protein